MIVKFAVSNFRSIKERIEIDMTKSALKGNEFNVSSKGKYDLLKSSMLYGANASGKSNFLRALKAMQYMVRISTSFKPNSIIGPYEPYRLNKDYVTQPVVFEIEFLLGDIKYEYKFGFTERKIIFEELNFYPKHIKSLLFFRDESKKMKFGDQYKGAKKTISKLILDNQLFLSKGSENNVESLLEVYNYFTDEILIFSLVNRADSKHLNKGYIENLAEYPDSNFSKLFNKLVASLDTGIVKVQAKEANFEDFKFPDYISEEIQKRFLEDHKYETKTLHRSVNTDGQSDFESFDVKDESTGTQSLFEIGGLILAVLMDGGVLIIDEFEKSLHPNLTRYLIDLFHNPIVNVHNSQLIFSTHDITQLSNENFRRDQIWFVEKDDEGSTSLFRCSNIKGVRLETPLDKWYASGRFGGTPVIDDTEFIMELQKYYEENNS